LQWQISAELSDVTVRIVHQRMSTTHIRHHDQLTFANKIRTASFGRVICICTHCAFRG